jgi:aminobenzoyl-glutamate utilization protein B
MRSPTPFGLLLLCLLIQVGHLYGQKARPLSALKQQAIRDLDPQHEAYRQIARQIWDYAEPGFKEVKSSELLQKTLADNGFAVQAGVAGMPTAFVASYGSGTPVIGILAEFDALAGLAQEAIAGQEAGHACGHHLLGTGAVAAGIELKKLIASNKLKGTVKVFGCPAEEVGRLAGSGNGKVFMVREGVFKDVDAAAG